MGWNKEAAGRRLSSRWEDSLLIQTLQQGFVLVIPLLMAGSMALVLSSFPVQAYQDWLAGFLGGGVSRLLHLVSGGTMDILSLAFILSISYCYGKNADAENALFYPAVALSSFVAFSFGDYENPLEIFQAQWMFTALAVTLLSCALFHRLLGWRMKRTKMYTPGADYTFNLVLRAILPAAAVVFLAAGLNVGVTALLGNVHVQNWGAQLFMKLFEAVGQGFFGTLLLVLSIHVLWFFGIHGSNMLEAVTQRIFENGLAVNQALEAAGQTPTEIYTKSFLDTFVMMGGCGTCLCLVIAVLVAGRQPSNRRLAKLAAAPVLFNINELMVFGLPLVLNPTLLIPFLLVPLMATCTSSLAVVLGLVPVTTHAVQWTVPAILSGYAATGSVAGSVLQAVNIVLGVLIYLPFVRRLETRRQEDLRESVDRLTGLVRQAEKTGEAPRLLEAPPRLAAVAKMLLADLRHDVKAGEVELYYQPQMRLDGTIYGGEALLRWHHAELGYLYPPLVIALAREDGCLDDLELLVARKTCADLCRLGKEIAAPLEISFNITPDRLSDDRFVDQLREQLVQLDFGPHHRGVEITEQVALSSTDEMDKRLQVLRDCGLALIMDDFGMGHSSMLYLQNQPFQMVKLDGKLVRSLMENDRSSSIIASIAERSATLDFELLAEFVETAEQRERLAALGCRLYQGYLYSPALPLDEFMAFAAKYTAVQPAAGREKQPAGME